MHSLPYLIVTCATSLNMPAVDLLEDRKERGAAVERRPEAVHLYGVDRMSTKECLQYFEDYGPSRVEWLDDSSCNVVFADAESAKRAIIGMGRPFGPGQAPDLQGICPLLPLCPWHTHILFSHWLSIIAGKTQILKFPALRARSGVLGWRHMSSSRVEIMLWTLIVDFSLEQGLSRLT